MTPKEKAQQLQEEIHEIASLNLNFMYEEDAKDISKMICNEVLGVLLSPSGNSLTEIYKYWKKVKKELK